MKNKFMGWLLCAWCYKLISIYVYKIILLITLNTDLISILVILSYVKELIKTQIHTNAT